MVLRILLWIVITYLVFLIVKWVLALLGIVIPAIFFTIVFIIIVILIVIKVIGVLK